MNREPRVQPLGIGLIRTANESDVLLLLRERRAAKTEADEQRAAGLQQISARKRGTHLL